MQDMNPTPRRNAARLSLRPGDIYESCNYHPVLCLGADYRSDEVWGISLVDGSYPHCCSLLHCGLRKLTPKQAWLLRLHGPRSAAARASVPKSKRWWSDATAEDSYRVGIVRPRRPRRPSG
jgi:hypothetical protein